MTRPAALGTPAARDWRDQVARAAAADVGRASEAEAIAQARKLADRGRLGAAAGLAVLAGLGAVAGWTTTAVQLRPGEGPVNAALALLVIAGGPWLLLLPRSLVLLALRRRASPVLGRLVTTGLVRAAGRDAGAGDLDTGAKDLAAATARRIGSMLAAGSGRHLAAAGSGTFWTAYAVVAVATIWIVTIRVALDFGWGWESSWVPPSFGQTVVELAAAPLAPLIGSDGLTPVAAAPDSPTDNPAALAARRAWLLFLTAGVAVYLLLPMAAWTLLQAVLGHRRALRWRPALAVVARSTAAATALPSGSAAPPPGPPPGGGPCTHVVRLERPTRAGGLPAPLDRLDDLGSVDAATDLERVRDIVHAGPARLAIVGWLPATPDRAIRRRLRTLADASHDTPLLVLDGGDALRRTEPASTAAVRLEDWHALAKDTGVDPFECDLAELTDASRLLLADAIGRQAAPNGGEPTPVPAPGPEAAGAGRAPAGLDPAPLDAAFGAIGQHLEGNDPLPSDAALASCLAEVARTFRAEAGDESRTAAWSARLAALRGLDRSDASGLAASLAATGGGQPGSPPADAAPDGPQRLGEAVFAAAAAAVLWWSQGADEARTTRALEALAPDDVIPALDDPDGARRWLATARDRVLAAAGREA